MFEAKPLAAAGNLTSDESWEGQALRELTWADLVARLSASRALRGAMGRTAAECELDPPALATRGMAAHFGTAKAPEPASLPASRGRR